MTQLYSYITTKATTCKSCGAAVYWARTHRNKKWIPMNSDKQTPHFATCPNANHHRRK